MSLPEILKNPGNLVLPLGMSNSRSSGGCGCGGQSAASGGEVVLQRLDLNEIGLSYSERRAAQEPRKTTLREREVGLPETTQPEGQRYLQQVWQHALPVISDVFGDDYHAAIELDGREAAIINAIVGGLMDGRFADLPAPDAGGTEVFRQHISAVAVLTPRQRGKYLVDLVAGVANAHPSSNEEMELLPPCNPPLPPAFGDICPTTQGCAAWRRVAPPVWAQCERFNPGRENVAEDCICVRYDPSQWPWWVWLIIGVIGVISLGLLIRLATTFGRVILGAPVIAQIPAAPQVRTPALPPTGIIARPRTLSIGI